MLFLTESDVLQLLPMREAVRLVREAFERLRAGEAVNEARRRLRLPTRSMLHSMAASDGRYFGAKIYSTHPVHGAHFLLLLYRAEDARPLAVIEASHLGRIRTGAASAVATGVLAAADAASVGMIGAGFQARAQLEAMLAVRPIKLARVWSRSTERRAAFAAACARDFGIAVEAAASAREAVAGADIVITATNSREPVVESSLIGADAHINAIGSNQPDRRELPADLVRRAAVIVVDSLEQARAESGDLLMALEEDEWRRVVELKDVIGSPGQRPPGITLFKSNGLAVEDMCCAGLVYERAVERGLGRELVPAHS